MANKLRYEDFWDRIDVDAFEEAIGFTPIDTDHNGNDVGHCLFPENHTHGDQTGKFAIHREKRVYNCWACGGGSLLSLVVELFPEMDFDEATDYLYEFAHGDLRTDTEFLDEFLAAFEDAERRVETLPYFNPRVLERFEPVPEWYLAERCILPEVAEQFKVSFNPHNVKKPPLKSKFAEDPMYSGPAIIFPLFWQDRLVGWQNRWLGDDLPEWCKKYTNTSGFPKDSTLFGYDHALTQKGPVVVVESVPTSLFLISCGYNSVATFGSSVNEPQMRLLRRFHQGVILGRDNDKAGERWLQANTRYLSRFVPVLHLPTVRGEGSDLGDLANTKDPVDRVVEIIEQAYEPEVTL